MCREKKASRWTFAFIIGILAYLSLFARTTLAADYTTKVDGILFYYEEQVYFDSEFTAFTDAKASKKQTMKSGNYYFLYKLTNGEAAPYVFHDANNKKFYVKESQMPRDYLVITFHPNGATDKGLSQIKVFNNGDGTYTVPYAYKDAAELNLCNVASLFSYSSHYVSTNQAWSVGSVNSADIVSEEVCDLSDYCAGSTGPIELNLYANWLWYTMNKGTNDTRYLFVNSSGIYSSATLSPENIPDWVPASEYDWTMPADYADYGTMSAPGASTYTDEEGTVHLTGVKSITYSVDQNSKAGNAVVTVTAKGYVQKYMFYAYRWRAHRGNMDRFPENTIEAFVGACKQGAMSLETDIQVTTDGKIVCYHDTNFKILNNSDGNPFSGRAYTMSWDQIKTFTFRNANGLHSQESKENLAWYQELCTRCGYTQEVTQTGKVATFEAYLQICKAYNVIPSIEIKGDNWSSEDFAKVGRLLSKYGFNSTNAVVGDFNKEGSTDRIVEFCKATDYKFTVFWTDSDPDGREADDYISLDKLQEVDSKITHVGTTTSLVGGADYKVRSTKQGYNEAFGQTGHDWKYFRGYNCTCPNCTGNEVNTSEAKDNTKVLEEATLKLGSKITKSGVTYKVTARGTKSSAGCVELTAFSGSGKTLTIPDTITGSDQVTYRVNSIAANACKNKSKLASVKIGKYVKTIGKNAFYNCKSLKTVSGCQGLITIGSSAFSGCKSLKKVSSCVNVREIGSSAFLNCSKLTTISGMQQLESIGAKAFYKCSSLIQLGDQKKTVQITADEIGANAFNGCKSLQKLLLSSSYLELIPASAFSDCSKLASVSVSGGMLKTIGASAFSGCSKMTGFTSASSVLSSIGSKCFMNCSSLKTVNIKTTKLSAKTVGDKAFSGISSNCTFKVPKSKVKAYKKIILAKGAPSSVKVLKG